MIYNFNLGIGWASSGVAWTDVLLGTVLFVVGVIGAYLLVRYQRKKDAEATKN